MVALATTKRVEDSQAISCSTSFQNEDVILSYLPEFVAKTEALKDPIPRSFVLKSLEAGGQGTKDEALSLGPVRTLIYIHAKVQNVDSSPQIPVRLSMGP